MKGNVNSIVKLSCKTFPSVLSVVDLKISDIPSVDDQWFIPEMRQEGGGGGLLIIHTDHHIMITVSCINYWHMKWSNVHCMV